MNTPLPDNSAGDVIVNLRKKLDIKREVLVQQTNFEIDRLNRSSSFKTPRLTVEELCDLESGQAIMGPETCGALNAVLIQLAHAHVGKFSSPEYMEIILLGEKFSVLRKKLENNPEPSTLRIDAAPSPKPGFPFGIAKQTFASHLRTERRRLHKPVTDISEACGFDAQTLYQWERGVSLPSQEGIEAVAAFLYGGKASKSELLQLWENAHQLKPAKGRSRGGIAD